MCAPASAPATSGPPPRRSAGRTASRASSCAATSGAASWATRPRTSTAASTPRSRRTGCTRAGSTTAGRSARRRRRWAPTRRSPGASAPSRRSCSTPTRTSTAPASPSTSSSASGGWTASTRSRSSSPRWTATWCAPARSWASEPVSPNGTHRRGPAATIAAQGEREGGGLGGQVGRPESRADAVRRNRELQRRFYGEPLGDRLRRLLGALDVSQTVLAVTLGVSSPMLSQLMSGRRVKIGAPAVLGPLLLLEQRGAAGGAGSGPEAVARLLAEVREAELRNDYDLLRTVAGPEELAAAAATLDPGFPSLAGLLRRAAAGG